MIRVLLVDDHAMFREGLRTQFSACSDIAVAAEGDSAKALPDLVERHQPDVVVLDMKLPDGNGVSAIAAARARRPGCRFVMLTMYDHVRYATHALKAGAEGYVVKGEPFSELLKAIREVHAGRTCVSAAMTPKLMGRLRQPLAEGPLDMLSRREFEVLTMIGEGLSAKEMANRLDINKKTITTYRSRLMQKLGLQSNADLIRFALESGLVD